MSFSAGIDTWGPEPAQPGPSHPRPQGEPQLTCVTWVYSALGDIVQEQTTTRTRTPSLLSGRGCGRGGRGGPGAGQARGQARGAR